MEEIRTTVQEPVAAQPVVAAAQAPVATENKKKNKLVGIIIVIAAAVVVLAAAVIAFATTRPAYVAKKYAESACIQDIKALDKCTLYNYKDLFIRGYEDESEMLEDATEAFGMYIGSWDEYCKQVMLERKYDMEDDYGPFKLTSDIRTQRDMSVKKAMDEMPGWTSNALEEIGFDWYKVSKVKAVSVHVIVNGAFDNDADDIIVYLVPHGLGWKAVDWSAG